MKRFFMGLRKLRILSNLLLGMLAYCFCDNFYKDYFDSIGPLIWALANLYLVGLIIRFIACSVIRSLIICILSRFRASKENEDTFGLQTKEYEVSAAKNQEILKILDTVKQNPEILMVAAAILLGTFSENILDIAGELAVYVTAESLKVLLSGWMITMEVLAAAAVYIFYKYRSPK